MSEFIITRDVIDSIRIARDVQLQENPSSVNNRHDLAFLAINNGERKEFVLEHKKLLTWIDTFSARELGEVRARFEEREIREEYVNRDMNRRYEGELLVFYMEASEIAFRGQPPKVSCDSPIELHIIEGVAQKVETIDRDELKKVKKANQLRRKQERLRDQIRKLEDNIAASMFELKSEGEKTQESQVWLASKPLEEALENAIERKARVREVARIKRKLKEGKPVLLDLFDIELIDPFEAEKPKTVHTSETCDWLAEGTEFIEQEPRAVDSFNRYYESYLEAKRHEESYKPRKSWSNTATKERTKRADITKRARMVFEGFIEDKLSLWKAELKELEIASYQKHRKQVRAWPKCEQRVKAEIESLELDLEAKRRELERIEI